MSQDLTITTFDPDVVDPKIALDYFTTDYEDGEDGIYTKESMDKVEEASKAFYKAFYDYDNNNYLTFGRVWIGKYSTNWTGNTVRRVPRVVEAVSDFYHEHGSVFMLTPQMVAPITLMFNLPHDSTWELPDGEPRSTRIEHRNYPAINKARRVKKFLLANMGRYTFINND